VLLVVETVRVEVAELPGVRLMTALLSEVCGPSGMEGRMSAVRLTSPAKPLILVSWMVELTDDPAVTSKNSGTTIMRKSGMEETVASTETTTLCDFELLVAVTTRSKSVANVSVSTYTVSGDWALSPPVKVTLNISSDTAKPAGTPVVLRFTVPSKPLRLAMAIRAVPVVEGEMVSEVG